MKVERITYKRVKNLGNYESETLELSAILDEEEEYSLDINIQMLKIKIQHHLGILNEDKSDEMEF